MNGGGTKRNHEARMGLVERRRTNCPSVWCQQSCQPGSPRTDVLCEDVSEIGELTTPELIGRHANKPSKDKSKVTLIAKTNFQAQLRDWHVT